MKRDFVIGIVTGVIGTLMVVGAGFWGYYQGALKDTVLENPKHIEKLSTLEKMIDQYYLNEKDEDMLAEGVYSGLLAGLQDVYSRYYTAEQYEAEMHATDGSYVGIGILMVKNPEGGVRVYECYRNSPAELAGIQADDVITRVNDTDITDLLLSEVAALIDEEIMDQVTLTVYRKDCEDPIEVNVKIDDVDMPMVEHDLLDSETGYIKIEEFTRNSYDQFMEAYAELKGRGMKKMIIDLRDNPGGLMDTVCNILRELLPEGLIVYTEDKYGNRDEIICEGNHPIDIPLAVLVNGNSASASEIFAGAIQDYGVGTIVGTTTFGKGIVQSLFKLTDGSALKLTVSNYYTPDGHSIHGVGITPDVVEELDEKLMNQSQYTYAEDNQIQKALEVLKIIS